jgi:Skp family chaperone for outer membrane proteins
VRYGLRRRGPKKIQRALIHPKNKEIQRLVSALASTPEVHRYSEILGDEMVTSIKGRYAQKLEGERTKNAQNEQHMRNQNDNLHPELQRQGSMQELGSESAQRGDMQIKALEIESQERKKELTRMRNELKKRVEPKRQRTVYSKENAPTNSRVEQISAPQPKVSKSGRPVKPSRRARGD